MMSYILQSNKCVENTMQSLTLSQACKAFGLWYLHATHGPGLNLLYVIFRKQW